MAASSNTTWVKGFTGHPTGATRCEQVLAELVAAIGNEEVLYPQGSEEAVVLTRREALVRTLWTRGVIDGDMTAIKLLIELVQGKAAGEGEHGPLFTADEWAAAEALYKVWAAEHAPEQAAQENDGDGG